MSIIKDIIYTPIRNKHTRVTILKVLKSCLHECVFGTPAKHLKILFWTLNAEIKWRYPKKIVP